MATGNPTSVGVPLSVVDKQFAAGLHRGTWCTALKLKGRNDATQMNIVTNGSEILSALDAPKMREELTLGKFVMQTMTRLSSADAMKSDTLDEKMIDGKISKTRKKLSSFETFLVNIYLPYAFARSMYLHASNTHGQGIHYFEKKKLNNNMKLLDRYTEHVGVTPPAGFRDEMNLKGAIRSADYSWAQRAWGSVAASLGQRIHAYWKSVHTIEMSIIGHHLANPNDVLGDDYSKVKDIETIPSLYFKMDDYNIGRFAITEEKLTSRAYMVRAICLNMFALDLWCFANMLEIGRCWTAHNQAIPAQGDFVPPQFPRDWNRARNLFRRRDYVRRVANRLTLEEEEEAVYLLDPERSNNTAYMSKVKMAALEKFQEYAEKFDLNYQYTESDLKWERPERKADGTMEKSKKFKLNWGNWIAMAEKILHQFTGAKDPTLEFARSDPDFIKKVMELLGFNYSCAEREPPDFRNPIVKNLWEYVASSLAVCAHYQGSQFTDVAIEKVSYNAHTIFNHLSRVFTPAVEGIGTDKEFSPVTDLRYRNEKLQASIPIFGPTFGGQANGSHAAARIAAEFPIPAPVKSKFSVMRIGVTMGEVDISDAQMIRESSLDTDRLVILLNQVDSYTTLEESGDMNRLTIRQVYPIKEQTFPHNPKLDNLKHNNLMAFYETWDDEDYLEECRLRNHKCIYSLFEGGEVLGDFNKIVPPFRSPRDLMMISEVNAYGEEFYKNLSEYTDIDAPWGIQADTLHFRDAMVMKAHFPEQPTPEAPIAEERLFLTTTGEGAEPTGIRLQHLSPLTDDNTGIVHQQTEAMKALQEMVSKYNEEMAKKAPKPDPAPPKGNPEPTPPGAPNRINRPGTGNIPSKRKGGPKK